MPDTVEAAIAALNSALIADGASTIHGAAGAEPSDWRDIALTTHAPRVRPRATTVLAVRSAEDGPTPTGAPFVHANLLAPSSPAALQRHAHAAWRKAIARDIASCRMRAAATAGLALPALQTARRGRVVYLGPPNADCLALDAGLRQHGHEMVMAVTPMSALDALHGKAPSSFVLHADEAPARALTILTTLQRGRLGARVPAFVVSPRQVLGETQAYLDKGAHSVWRAPEPHLPRLADWIHDALSRQIEADRIEALSRVCDEEARQRPDMAARFFPVLVQTLTARRTTPGRTGYVATLAMKRDEATTRSASGRGLSSALANVIRSADIVWQPTPEQCVIVMPTATEFAARLVLDRVVSYGEQALGVVWRNTTLAGLPQWARDARLSALA